MSDELDIEYREFTLDLLESLRERDKPLLEKFVISIGGVPLAECDSETKMRAGFQVARFLLIEMKDFSEIMPSRKNGDGGPTRT